MRTKCKGKQRPTKSKPSVLPSMTEKIDFIDVNMESEQCGCLIFLSL